MRNPRRTTAALGKRENIPARERVGVIEIFYQAIIEKGYVRLVGQGVAVFVEQGANFNPAENFDLFSVLVL